MNKLKKLKLASAIAFSLLAPDVYADIIELDDNAVRATSVVGKITVTHEDGSFFVTKQDKKFSVERHNTDSLLRDLTGEQLKGFTKANNYLQVTELSNGEFKLDGKVRAPGGGPVVATVLGVVGAVFCPPEAPLLYELGMMLPTW